VRTDKYAIEQLRRGLPVQDGGFNTGRSSSQSGFIAVWDNDNTSSRSAVVTPSRFTAPLERDSALSQEITDANRSAGHTISNRTEAGSDHRNDSEAGLDTAASNQAARSCTRAAPGKYDRNDLGHSEDDILWRNSLREIE
jgi:hypothetical protein